MDPSVRGVWGVCGFGFLLLSKKPSNGVVMASSSRFLKSNCVGCGIEFMASESNIEKGNGRFCSKSCAAKNGAGAERRLKVLRKNHVKGLGRDVSQKARRTNRPDIHAAHAAVSRALKCGKLNRLPCERCGSLESHAHHENYAQPLAVNWLCKKHHAQRHVELMRVC
jgi:hypothetical protein